MGVQESLRLGFRSCLFLIGTQDIGYWINKNGWILFMGSQQNKKK